MKPFIWITALILSLPFLASAAFTGYNVLERPDILANPESKVPLGWLFTGMMFFGISLRGARTGVRRALAA